MQNIITPSFIEDHISQIPALQLLQNMGYTYLPPEEAFEQRQGKFSNVLLEDILEEQLHKINSITFKGKEYQFSAGNIKNAIAALKDVPLFDGLVITNEKVYDLLTLGKSFEENIGGDKKSFTVNYIDWKNPENNVFHVVEEFEISKTASEEKRRPDLVLFVNGIPLVVIECKRPDIKDPTEQAISQNIRNQYEDEIPKLFVYSQLLLAISENDGKYATVGTPKKFWASWNEKECIQIRLEELINKPLSQEQKNKLFKDRFYYVKQYFEALEQAENRIPTKQDKLLYSLCNPKRLLELVYQFIIFDAGVKKVARYQQYFAVKNSIERIKHIDKDNKRSGGVIWHTQGSGKSLTMVMMAKAISLEPSIIDPKIIIVTDRVDLDDQIKTTFHQCGKDPIQAKSGEHLINIIEGNKEAIITTIIDKFRAAVRKRSVKNEYNNIFVLVDESHRSQYGSANAMMQKVFPKACYIGFTGTPLMKDDKNTANKFGGIIDKYTIDQAVDDKAVLPLYYEGRLALQDVNKKPIDKWFEVVSRDLTEKQRADLKKKFSTRKILNEADHKIYNVAFDISQHFSNKYQGTGFKGQLTAPSKLIALKYKEYLDEFGMVTSDIIMSAPDTREGNEDIYEESSDKVNAYWKTVIKKYGNEKNYNKQVINAYKHAKDPEIIIVVDKLLTGFDEPKNSVLYIARSLKEHGLLQAIARVNRLYEGKDYGEIVDYYGLLGELDQALTTYSELESFDENDIAGSLINVMEEVKTLPQKHSDLWEIFNGINKQDLEAYERLLAPEDIRDKFYNRLSAFAKTLQTAMGTVKFIEETPEEKINNYKKDAKFFLNLRVSVKSRYAETIDHKEYEPKIQKLIDTYVTSEEVIRINEPVNIFDVEKFEEEVGKKRSNASKADTIAYRIKKTITEKMDEDPAFYEKLSEMLKKTIEKYRDKICSEAERLKNDKEYLSAVTELLKKVQTRTGDELPESLKHYDVAKAFYGVVLQRIKEQASEVKDISAEIALKIDQAIINNKYVDWLKNDDLQNKMINEIEDILFEVKGAYGLNLSFDDIDFIIEQSMSIARKRYAE